VQLDSSASRASSASNSPFSAAAKKLSASRSRSSTEGSNLGLPSWTCRRAREDELAGVALARPDDLRDLVVAVLEDVV
jgi:hypothetical protein